MKQLLLGFMLLLPSTLIAGESGITQFPELSWTGFYIGGNLGEIWSKFRGYVADVPYFDHNGVFFPSFPQPYNAHQNSFTYGAQLGYLYQTGHIILGSDLNVLGLNLKDRHTLRAEETQAFIDIFKPGDSFSSKMKWQASWVARIGPQVENFIFYGLGGITVMRPKISTHITSIVIDGVFFPADQGEDKRILVGGTVGLGGEYAIWSNFSIGLEYRYTDFGREHYDVGQDPVSTLPNGFIYTALKANKKLETNLLLFRLNYYFKAC